MRQNDPLSERSSHHALHGPQIINEKGEIESLVSYRSMINQAIIALDLHQCSEEIGSLMIDGVTEVMQPEDGFVEDLPSSLIDLVSASDNVKSNIESSYSNTKLYFSLLATIHESFSGYGSHLGQNENQTKKRTKKEEEGRRGRKKKKREAINNRRRKNNLINTKKR